MNALSFILDAILPPRRSKREIDGMHAEDLGALLAPTTLPSHPFPTIILFSYNDTLVRSLIREAKFHGNTKAQALLGNALADFLLEYLSEEPSGETVLLVPVPLSKERLEERGYNQVERICSEALQQLPLLSLRTDILMRTRHTEAQSALTGSLRRKNLSGAYSAQAVDGAHTYIVVDDVTTTGTTLAAAVDALVQAGARRIIPLALAH